MTAVAEAGSLTKAAEKLFLTQSALSHQLKDIESQLGCSLFTRVNKKLIITNAGVAFLNAGGVILNEITRLQTDIQRMTIGETGKVRLITQSSTCYHWLPRILKVFQGEYPNVDVQLNSEPINKPVQLLNAGKFDVALVHEKGNEKSIEYIELFTDEVVALIPTADPLSARPYLTAKDFKTATYFTHSKQIGESSFFADFLKPHKVTPKKVVNFPLTETIVAMVNEGLGMTVMANWLASSYQPSNFKLVRITRPGLLRKWYIAIVKDNRPGYVDRFVELLRGGIPVPPAKLI